MKLFDLLKSLNHDIAADPDARAKLPDSNQRLLDELNNLLGLLDTPAPTLPIATRTHEDPATPMLNLANIFEETIISEETIEPESSPPLSATNGAAPTYRPVVRELLDEFLPMLTQTLGERLDQLDDVTLQQWRHAIARRAGESEPAAD